MLVVSLLLVLGATAQGAAGVSMVSLGGLVYIEASSLASHIGAKLERSPERLYLRSRGHLVTLTRGWARVEVDGKPVVLDAPVRVDQERWLVPEAFTRQVLPMLGGRPPGGAPIPAAVASAPAARASEPGAAAPRSGVAEQPRVTAPGQVSGASAKASPAPAVAATQSPVVAPVQSGTDRSRAAVSPAPPSAAVSAPAVMAPAAPVAGPPRMSAPSPPVTKQPEVIPPATPVVEAPRVAMPARPVVEPPRTPPPSPPVSEQPRMAAPAAPILEPARATAAPGMVMEAPRAGPPAVRVIEPSRPATFPPPAAAPVTAPARAPAPAPAQPVEAPRGLPAAVPKASEPAPAAVAPPKSAAPPVRVIEAPKGPASGKMVAAVPPVSDGGPGATLEDLRLRSYPTFTRVVVETSALVRHRIEAVTPKELRIRLGALSASRRAEEVRDGLVEDVQIEPAEGDAVLRVTFTGASQEPKVSALTDPPRLLFDFGRPPEPGSRGQALGAPGPLRTLVLDAGHGGHDSGAVGPAGLMEKDLVLDVTRRVAALVEARLPGIRVLLSRKGDYFVPLRDRTSYANRERADLFVSIHANAHRESASEGVETFFLSSEATDSAARQVAAAENSVVKLERPAARGARADVVKAILWDLAQSGFQQESSRLAEVVQDSMTQSLRIPNRGVKQAGFYVLGGAAMPAVLVEIGFVTNPREERRLKESSYRDEIAQAIFAGVAEYRQDVERRASRAAARQP
jgi:N-acetylmuramoyl-L-alanine amidase